MINQGESPMTTDRRITDEQAAERERDEALAVLSAAGIATPIEGYAKAPHMLAADIRRLACERDEELRLLREARGALQVAQDAFAEEKGEFGRLWASAVIARIDAALAADVKDSLTTTALAAPPAPDANPAVLARHAAVQAGDLSGTVDLPDPRDAVVGDPTVRGLLLKCRAALIKAQPKVGRAWAQLLIEDIDAALDGRQGGE